MLPTRYQAPRNESLTLRYDTLLTIEKCHVNRHTHEAGVDRTAVGNPESVPVDGLPSHQSQEAPAERTSFPDFIEPMSSNHIPPRPYTKATRSGPTMTNSTAGMMKMTIGKSIFWEA